MYCVLIWAVPSGYHRDTVCYQPFVTKKNVFPFPKGCHTKTMHIAHDAITCVRCGRTELIIILKVRFLKIIAHTSPTHVDLTTRYTALVYCKLLHKHVIIITHHKITAVTPFLGVY